MLGRLQLLCHRPPLAVDGVTPMIYPPRFASSERLSDL
jgi:hypothetical protein